MVATVEIAWPDRRIGFMTAEQAEDKKKLEKLGWRILNLLDIANMDVASYFAADKKCQIILKWLSHRILFQHLLVFRDKYKVK